MFYYKTKFTNIPQEIFIDRNSNFNSYANGDKETIKTDTHRYKKRKKTLI